MLTADGPAGAVVHNGGDLCRGAAQRPGNTVSRAGPQAGLVEHVLDQLARCGCGWALDELLRWNRDNYLHLITAVVRLICGTGSISAMRRRQAPRPRVGDGAGGLCP